jgi:hypothetical protein
MNKSIPNSLSQSRLIAYSIAAIALTMVTGLVYGRWTQRWGQPPSLQAAAERVESLPREIGPWRLVEEREVSKLILETLQCAGHTNRIYMNVNTGEKVAMAMIVGPSGPTSVHIPEICYSSRAFEIAQPREEKFFGGDSSGKSNSFWEMKFKSQDAGVGELQVYYGWSTGDAWTASQSPRFEFGGRPLLYKLQVSAELAPTDGGSQKDPCRSFIDELLKTFWQARSGRSGA